MPVKTSALLLAVASAMASAQSAGISQQNGGGSQTTVGAGAAWAF